MTVDQENKVCWNGNSEDFCGVKQPLLFKVKYLLFYLSFRGNLDWENSWFVKSRKGYRAFYGGILLSDCMNYTFSKVDNATRYDTKVSYISDPLVTLKLENWRDLSEFCAKKFKTKENCNVVKTPTKYQFLKYFYPKLWIIKHKGATLHFNIFNQLVRKENTEQIVKDCHVRLSLEVLKKESK